MKKILVVVDMQNDFIDGALGTEEAQKILPRVVDKINERKAEGYTVIFTQDTHADDYLNTMEGKNLPVLHCVKGTRGWELNDDIGRAAEGCAIYEKNTFGSVDLMHAVASLRPDVVEFVGLCTDICVVSNVLGVKAAVPEAEIVVDSGCCAGATVKGHNAALETMRACQVKII